MKICFIRLINLFLVFICAFYFPSSFARAYPVSVGSYSGVLAATWENVSECRGMMACVGDTFACAGSGVTVGQLSQGALVNATWSLYNMVENGEIHSCKNSWIFNYSGISGEMKNYFLETPTDEVCAKRPDIPIADPSTQKTDAGVTVSLGGYPVYSSDDSIFADIAGCVYEFYPLTNSGTSAWRTISMAVPFNVDCKDGVESYVCKKPEPDSPGGDTGGGGTGGDSSSGDSSGGAAGGDSSGSDSSGGASGGGTSGGDSSGGTSDGGSSGSDSSGSISGGGTSGGGSSSGTSGGSSSGSGSSGSTSGGSSSGSSSSGSASSGGTSGGSSSGSGISGSDYSGILGWLRRIYDSLSGQSAKLDVAADSLNTIKQNLAVSSSDADSAVSSADGAFDSASDGVSSNYLSESQKFWDNSLSSKYLPDADDYFILNINKVINPGNLQKSLPVKVSFTLNIPGISPWVITVDTTQYTDLYDEIVRPLVEWAFNIMTAIVVYRIIRRAVLSREMGSV